MNKLRLNPISVLATLVNKQTKYNLCSSPIQVQTNTKNKEDILQKNDKQVLCVLEFYLLHVSDINHSIICGTEEISAYPNRKSLSISSSTSSDIYAHQNITYFGQALLFAH